MAKTAPIPGKSKLKPKSKPKTKAKATAKVPVAAGGKRHSNPQKFRAMITRTAARRLLRRAGITTFSSTCIEALTENTLKELREVLKYAALYCNAKGRVGITSDIMATALERSGVCIL